MTGGKQKEKTRAKAIHFNDETKYKLNKALETRAGTLVEHGEQTQSKHRQADRRLIRDRSN